MQFTTAPPTPVHERRQWVTYFLLRFKLHSKARFQPQPEVLFQTEAETSNPLKLKFVLSCERSRRF